MYPIHSWVVVDALEDILKPSQRVCGSKAADFGAMACNVDFADLGSDPDFENKVA